MRSTTRTWVVAAIAAIAIAGLVAPATAASTDPLVEVQFWVDGDDTKSNGFLLVTGTLPPETSLPATLTLPVPDGAALVWAGELVGQSLEADIERQVTIDEGEGGLIASMSLETTLTGQYEAVYLPTVPSGDAREARLEWKHTTPVSRALFSIVLPPGADKIDLDPVPVSGPARNRAGESLYVMPDVELPELGTMTEMSVSYTPGSLLGDRGPDSTSTTLLVLGVVAALLGVVLVVVLRAQSRNRLTEDPGEDEE